MMVINAIISFLLLKQTRKPSPAQTRHQSQAISMSGGTALFPGATAD
jgi:hypothetical protein